MTRLLLPILTRLTALFALASMGTYALIRQLATPAQLTTIDAWLHATIDEA